MPRVTCVTPWRASSTTTADEVACRHFLAQNDDVAPALGIGLDNARQSVGIEIGEDEFLAVQFLGREARGTRHVEAQGIGQVAPMRGIDIGKRTSAPKARIDEAALGIELVVIGGAEDFGPGRKAGIKKPEIGELLRRQRIIGEVVRLAKNQIVPGYAEPPEIIVDSLDMLGPAPCLVDVLDAQQEAAAKALRHFESGQRRKRMPEMQRAVGRGCKT